MTNTSYIPTNSGLNQMPKVTRDCAIAPASPTAQALSELNSATDSLSNLVNMLESRLTQALECQSEKPCEPCQPPQPAPYRVPIANDIANIRGQVINISQRIETLLGRVGV